MSELLGAALGSAVSGGLGLIGNAINYNYQKNLASQQNQYNIDMWKMQAEYNSPQAQMQRFQEAGLNPNLIYGQGNNGNMSQPPQMVTPEAPEVSKSMQEIGKAFNVENLRTIIANRKKVEEEAHQERLATKNMQDERAALHRLSFAYDYDLTSGRYIPASVGVIRETGLPPYELPTDIARMNKYLASVDPRMQSLASQRAYLSPQIWMANYEKEHYPISYWVGTAGKGAKAVGDITSVFNPSRYLMPLGEKTRGFITPSGRLLKY